ncbi:MAG: hypothetical protein KA716_11945 [Gloeotrichia echinulata DEX184]|nr:hypothetical protein [Gloeotrichia echinulata DEX184]
MTKNSSLQRLNKRQVRAYIKDNDCSLDTSLNSQTPTDLLFVFDKIYRCTDGKILAVSKAGTGNLYGSTRDWQSELDKLVELGKREPVHILYNQIPSPERFIQEIPYLVSNLARELELDLSEMNKTLESLLIVDQAIESKNRQGYIDDSSNRKILGSLIAYVGEVVKTAIDGQWLIKRDNNGSGWEPVIVGSNGKTSSFCVMVFDELYEAEESSFYDIASLLIEAHQQ